MALGVSKIFASVLEQINTCEPAADVAICSVRDGNGRCQRSLDARRARRPGIDPPAGMNLRRELRSTGAGCASDDTS
jgi:hypothetical protein